MSGRSILPSVSVRIRLTLWLVALVALALGGAGLTVATLQEARVVEQAGDTIALELDELVKLQEGGVDPETGTAFRDAPTLVETFLSRNVAEEHELLAGWWDGRVTLVSQDDPLTSDPRFVEAAARSAADGATRRVTASDGADLLVGAQPIADPDLPDAALLSVIRLDDARDAVASTMRTYTIVALLGLVIVAGLAAAIAGRLLAPLRTLREAAAAITATDLSRRMPVRGNDDITALTRTLNDMLERLDAGFAGQRRFLDDAGHELRTPLTVLRGHLELLDARQPADVEETRALLLDEVDRMSGLVDDLILLAKSDRPDFITPVPVHLGRLTHSIHAKARAIADRAWQLDASASLPSAGDAASDPLVDLDERRVTQALLQLADNAVKHTAPGTRIVIGSRLDPAPAEQPDGVDEVRLWVADEGPGIPAVDRERVLERFGRSAVPDGDEGFGLGLSIVRAIAQAHGGRVEVHDAVPGQDPPGALVVLVLPADRESQRRRHEDGVHNRDEEPAWPAS